MFLRTVQSSIFVLRGYYKTLDFSHFLLYLHRAIGLLTYYLSG